MTKSDRLLKVLYLLYFLVLTWLLYFYSFSTYSRLEEKKYDINLVPFKTINRYWVNFYDYYQYHGMWSWLANTIGNIVLFIPMGTALMTFFPLYSKYKLLYISLVILLSLELTQYILNVGMFDIDDIILNFTGVLIGYLIVKLIRK